MATGTQQIEWWSQMAAGTRWDDLRFPAQAINPPGGASDADVEATTGLLLFAGNGTEVVFGVAQLPHSWREGSAIVPHVHWQKTTSAAGDVLWQRDYEVIANGETAAMDYGSQLQVSSPVAGTPDTDTANNVMISSFGEIDMTGQSVSCMVLWKLSRIGGDEADSYAADARLLEFDIHFQVDSHGSESEFTKQTTGGVGI